MAWNRENNAAINAYFCHELLLLLYLWWLFNFRATWEVIIQARPKAKKKGKPSSSPSSDPKPFLGLTKKPGCQACTQEQNQPKEAPEPPPLMVSERGRLAQIDNSRQFCPHQDCRYYGWIGRGNIIANGHPSGGLWRQYYCKACGHWFLETHGTVFFGRRQLVSILLLVLAALGEGMGIRAAGRVFGLDPNTVQSWLVAAAEQLSAFASHFLVDLDPQQVQLDEVYVSLAHLLESDSESVEFKQGSSWVWTAMDPVTKLLLVIVVGKGPWMWCKPWCIKSNSAGGLMPADFPHRWSDSLPDSDSNPFWSVGSTRFAPCRNSP